MTVRELNRSQMIELKQDHICKTYDELDGSTPSIGTLADADRIVPDWMMFEEYDDVEFSEDDFFCSSGL